MFSRIAFLIFSVSIRIFYFLLPIASTRWVFIASFSSCKLYWFIICYSSLIKKSTAYKSSPLPSLLELEKNLTITLEKKWDLRLIWFISPWIFWFVRRHSFRHKSKNLLCDVMISSIVLTEFNSYLNLMKLGSNTSKSI